MGTFTKKDFIDLIHNIVMNSNFKWKDSFTKTNSEEIYDQFTEKLIEAIKKNPDGLKFGRLGTFKIKKKAGRKGKNPRTGEVITIPPKRDLTFKASSNIKEELNS